MSNWALTRDTEGHFIGKCFVKTFIRKLLYHFEVWSVPPSLLGSTSEITLSSCHSAKLFALQLSFMLPERPFWNALCYSFCTFQGDATRKHLFVFSTVLELASRKFNNSGTLQMDEWWLFSFTAVCPGPELLSQYDSCTPKSLGK